MNGSPEEMRSWLQRAKSFVRGLNHLPGEWGISVSITPPISSEDADRFAAELPRGLPAPLRTLYVAGAGNFHCHYHWTPRDEKLRRIRQIFPYEHSLYGGPSFIPWDQMVSSRGIYGWCYGWDDPDGEEQKKALEIWKQTIPFIDVGNGDAVGLHVTSESDSCPVVYLCHDDPDHAVTPISPSFEHFLTEWEKLCYIGPEIWLLSAFLPKGKPLTATGPKALKWREIMRPE